MKKITVILMVVIIILIGFGWFYNANSRILFEKEGLWGYKNLIGQEMIAPRYILAEKFSRYGIAPVCDPDQGWFYIDRQGKKLIKPYLIKNDNDFDRFSEGLARFEKDGRMGFFGPNGKIMIKPQFEYASSFQNHYAAVGLGVTKEFNGELEFIKAKAWGFIDQKGNLVIPYRYQEVISLFDKTGRAIVIKAGQEIMINHHGEKIFSGKQEKKI